METPGSARVTRSRSRLATPVAGKPPTPARASCGGNGGGGGRRGALCDLTNDSPIAGTVLDAKRSARRDAVKAAAASPTAAEAADMAAAAHGSPAAEAAAAAKAGAQGEDILRAQVTALLRMKDGPCSLEASPVLQLQWPSPAASAAPTPANTPVGGAVATAAEAGAATANLLMAAAAATAAAAQLDSLPAASPAAASVDCKWSTQPAQGSPPGAGAIFVRTPVVAGPQGPVHARWRPSLAPFAMPASRSLLSREGWQDDGMPGGGMDSDTDSEWEESADGGGDSGEEEPLDEETEAGRRGAAEDKAWVDFCAELNAVHISELGIAPLKGMPSPAGKHIRFVDDDNDGGNGNGFGGPNTTTTGASPPRAGRRQPTSAVRLAGVPAHRGSHIRFSE
eukprot:SM000296S11295  [mRNA]  locus=s296:72227:74169:- [translate_table: standard]